MMKLSNNAWTVSRGRGHSSCLTITTLVVSHIDIDTSFSSLPQLFPRIERSVVLCSTREPNLGH